MDWMENHKKIFKTDKPIIGCVHLAALPGTPHYDSTATFREQVARAKREIRALQDAGFDAIVFANEGDRPYLSKVGPEIVASYTRIVAQALDAVEIPYGCGVLVDPYAAISIAKAIDSSLELRNKKDLIEAFISSLTPHGDIDDEWAAFVAARREEELARIIG